MWLYVFVLFMAISRFIIPEVVFNSFFKQLGDFSLTLWLLKKFFRLAHAGLLSDRIFNTLTLSETGQYHLRLSLAFFDAGSGGYRSSPGSNFGLMCKPPPTGARCSCIRSVHDIFLKGIVSVWYSGPENLTCMLGIATVSYVFPQSMSNPKPLLRVLLNFTSGKTNSPPPVPYFLVSSLTLFGLLARLPEVDFVLRLPKRSKKRFETENHANGILLAKRRAVFSRTELFFLGCFCCF